MCNYDELMQLAISEAEVSLREGNCGFGAIIVRDGSVIAKAHDTEKTAGDPTAHAELTAIRLASGILGRNLNGCILVSTHEPCSMCSTATLWSGIDEIVYGYSIEAAIKQGRKRINLPCREIYDRAGKAVTIHDEVLQEECAVLYDKAVRDNIDFLRGTDEIKLHAVANELSRKRLDWFTATYNTVNYKDKDLLDAAYQLFLTKLGITENDAPIVHRDQKMLVLRSKNFCPTLEACRILGMDIRFVCKHLSEQPTTDMLRCINPKLRFARHYDKLRPYSEYCEEMIILDE